MHTPTYLSSSDNPNVAIIVPVFNSEQHLDDCLKSIAEQSYKQFTAFVVNDGSTDKSCEIIKKYVAKDNRFVVITQANKGQSSARNLALNQVIRSKKYDYVSFIDSDDIVVNEFLETLVSKAIETKSDITSCNYFLIENGIKVKQHKKEKAYTEKALSKQEYVELIFSEGSWRDISGSGGMVWKNLFKVSCLENARFTEERFLVEDELFCLIASTCAKKVYYSNKALYGYRQHPESLVKRKGFQSQLFKGRQMCLLASKNISTFHKLITTSAFIKAYLNVVKAGQRPKKVKREYYPFIILSYKRKLLSTKEMIRFIMIDKFFKEFN